jgi:methylphosphotriester-DNA--protein-cysteine methyltransferase
MNHENYTDKKVEARKFLDQIKREDNTFSKNDLARQIGVSVETCHNWVKKYYPEEFQDIRTARRLRRRKKIVSGTSLRPSPQLLKISIPEPKMNQALIKSLLQNAIINLQTISELMKD